MHKLTGVSLAKIGSHGSINDDCCRACECVCVCAWNLFVDIESKSELGKTSTDVI